MTAISHRKSFVPDVVRNFGAHAPLDVDLRHRETVIRKSFHQGTIKLEQLITSLAVHGQSYWRGEGR